MALVPPRTDPSPDGSTAIVASQLSGNLIAGEDLLAAAPCRVHSDGLVYMSNGTAADAEAKVHGMSGRAVKSGQPVTLYGPGTRFGYADSGLTPGARLFLAATDGRFDTAATTGDTAAMAGIAFAVSATDIMFAAYKV